MFGLTTLGIIHTAFSLVAVAAGIVCFVRYKEISTGTAAGQTYLVTTLITAVTGLGIFQHGGFGPPHVLSILTIGALAIGTLAAVTAVFGRASRYVQTIFFSATFLFHMIPGITETTTRLPLGAPLLPSADAPQLKVATLIFLVVYLIGVTLQNLRLRKAGQPT